MRGGCRWLSLCVLAGAIGVAVPALAASPPARATCGKLLPPASGAYLGAFTDFNTATRFDEDAVTAARIASFEALAGRKLSWVYFADHWWKGLQFPASRVLTIWRHGSIPYIAFQAHSGQLYGPGPRQQFPEPRFTLQRIIDGRFDDGLRRWADSARRSNIPILVEFGTEVNDGWGPWNGAYNGAGQTDGYGDPTYPDGPERFRDAYRHIVTLFREEGATNVTWFFHVDSYAQQESWNRLALYYPGDSYVDWVGISDYGSLSPSAPIVRFATKLDASGVYEDLRALTRRPIAIVEMGVVGRADRKAAWIRDAFAAIRAHRYPRIRGVAWWDTNSPPTDSRIDSAPAVLDAFRQAVGGFFFDATPRFTGSCPRPPAPTRRLLGIGTSLRITVWPRGRTRAAHHVWTLRCRPAGGTLPGAGHACVRLLALTRPFATTPITQACTEIYGGPQEALVTGTLAGTTVRATFNRRDGCQIGRWERISFLLR